MTERWANCNSDIWWIFSASGQLGGQQVREDTGLQLILLPKDTPIGHVIAYKIPRIMVNVLPVLFTFILPVFCFPQSAGSSSYNTLCCIPCIVNQALKETGAVYVEEMRVHTLQQSIWFFHSFLICSKWLILVIMTVWWHPRQLQRAKKKKNELLQNLAQVQRWLHWLCGTQFFIKLVSRLIVSNKFSQSSGEMHVCALTVHHYWKLVFIYATLTFAHLNCFHAEQRWHKSKK